MSSYDVLPIDANDLARIYMVSKQVDRTNESDVDYLLGVIEGVLGGYFTVTTAASPDLKDKSKAVENAPESE